MKTRGLKMIALFCLMGGGMAVQGQEIEREVPGDDFSLEGALELFKKSTSPEEFEKFLNEENSKVNNLDLNGDGYIDYVRVIDRNEGNIHTFTLQAVISDTDFQDVAVIELEKKNNGKAVLQIIGDEDVYGMETIIEPTQEVRVNAGTTTARTVVNVWAWPSVQYVYAPSYAVWVSPWSWHARPMGWYSWRPVTYHRYYSWWQPYRPYYVRCHTHRVVYAHRIYRPYRSTSVLVSNRHRDQITRYRTTNRDNDRSGRYAYDQTSRNNSHRADRSAPVKRSRESNVDRERNTGLSQQGERTSPAKRNPVNRQTPAPRKNNFADRSNDRSKVKPMDETSVGISSGDINRSRGKQEQARPVQRERSDRPSDRQHSKSSDSRRSGRSPK